MRLTFVTSTHRNQRTSSGQMAEGVATGLAKTDKINGRKSSYSLFDAKRAQLNGFPSNWTLTYYNTRRAVI